MNKIKILISLFTAGCFGLSAQVLTYKDVASAFYKSCTSCHHQGANHYSFINYTQTNQHKNLIYSALNSNRMPPWKADTNYTRFRHERLISASDKAKILNWIATGATKGDTTQAPPQPVYPPKYKLVGNADLTVSIPTFTSFATVNDIYVCFSIPTGLTQDRIIRAYEIVPGNAPLVHHAVITADTTGTYQSDLSGFCINIPGNMELGSYAPGAQPQIFPSMAPLKTGIRLKAGSNVILQMHYPKGTQGQIDSTKIRFYFYPPGETGVRLITVATPLQNWNMSIPANTTPTHVANFPTTGTLPAPMSLFGVFPHSHKLGKSMLLYAVNPNVDTIPMVHIPDWDFAWQDYYMYKKLVKIPAGYRLHARHVFNNTTSNLNNPNNPPINVTAGFGTNDEMLFDGIMYLPYQMGDELIDIEAIVNADTLLATNIKNNVIVKEEKIRAMAYPNPFKNEVTVKYIMNTAGQVNVTVKDLLGKEVLSLNEGKKDAGLHEFKLNDKQLSSGVYFYTIRCGNASITEKLVKEND
jgi:hypothetical protein